MRDILLTLTGITLLGVADIPAPSSWEHIFEKWGIGALGIGLFFLLAKWTAAREATLQLQRDQRDATLLKDQQDRDQRDQVERTRLMEENNRLQHEQLALAKENAVKLEGLVIQGSRAIGESTLTIRALLKRMKGCACISDPLPEHPPTKTSKTPPDDE